MIKRFSSTQSPQANISGMFVSIRSLTFIAPVSPIAISASLAISVLGTTPAQSTTKSTGISLPEPVRTDLTPSLSPENSVAISEVKISKRFPQVNLSCSSIRCDMSSSKVCIIVGAYSISVT